MFKFLIYSLLFFLPTQLGKHFWFDFSSKLGAQVDYLAPTIYFTDLIVFLIIAVYFLQKRICFKKLLPCFIVALFITYWLFIIKENFYLLFYNLVKLGEMVLLGLIIAKTVTRRDFPQVIKVLNLALVVQVCLALYQVVVEKSGGLWIIGEREFGILTPGIAKFQALSGHLLLRGYGTFPHPNVLAGFSLLLLAANLVFLRQEKRFRPWWLLGVFCSILGIFLSFSLFSWGLAVLIIVITLRKFYLYPLLAINYWLLITFLKSESVTRRWELLGISWQLFKTSPIFGIGLGNFIPKMPALPLGSTYFWQPVHNLPALIFTETGILGLIIIASLLYCYIAKHKKSLIILVWWGIVLATGLFDHYWLTLQQGRLMLALIIGLSLI